MAKTKLKELLHQKNISIHIEDGLDKKKFIIRKIHGIERISDCYEFTITISSSTKIPDISKLISTKIGISIETQKNNKRFFSGYIGFIKYTGTMIVTGTPNDQRGLKEYFYEVKFYPKLWWLKFNKHYRIFEDKSSIEIIKDVLKKHKIDFKDLTKKSGKTKHEYYVQYNESDFHFINRIMGNEGIFYFFTCDKSGEKLVLVDMNNSCPKITPFGSSKNYTHTNGGNILDTIRFIERENYAGIQDVKVMDYNFEKPNVMISASTNKNEQSRHDQYPTPDGHEAIFCKESIKPYSKNFQRSFISQQQKYKGTSFVSSFSAGHHFSLKSLYDKDISGEYLLLEVVHSFDISPKNDEKIYENKFTAINWDNIFHPIVNLYTQPKINSTQTAVVISPKKDDEIYTDKYGRIRVKFHWDDNDKTSSCWVRVAQNFAGNNFGSLFIPRVGQEVVVTFIDGNPNRPLVTGAVYNANNLPPYLPKEPNKSTIKTQSLRDKKRGYNEIRFDDKLNGEELYFRAERDLTTIVKHGKETRTIEEGDRTTEILGKDDESKGKYNGDDNLIIHKGNRKVELLSKGDSPTQHSTLVKKGNIIKEIKEGNLQTTLDKGNSITKIKSGNVDLKLDKGDYKIIISNGDQKVEINGAQKIEITKNQETNVSGDVKLNTKGAMTINATGNITLDSKGDIKIKSMKKITLDGKMGVDIKGMTVQMDAKTMINIKAKAMLNIDGSMINIKAKGVLTNDAAVIMNKSKAALINKATAAVINKGTAAVINKATGAAPIGKMVLLGV